MRFESLNEEHAESLLAFELQNRSFFEQVIAPRDPDFYSIEGVKNHITELLLQTDCYAAVLVKESAIIARANIRNISADGGAEVGYRVAENVTGGGTGSLCLAHLIEKARSLKLNRLTAVVMDNNPASEKVLLKNGFEPVRHLPNSFEHQGERLHAVEYGLDLA